MRNLFFTITVLLGLVIAPITTFSSHPVKSEAAQQELNAVIQPIHEVSTPSPYSEFLQKSVKSTKNIKAARRRGGNDQTTLLLLYFLLGAFAAHRWYAGKPTGSNILFILTLGGCGIWSIIDLVKIIQNDF